MDRENTESVKNQADAERRETMRVLAPISLGELIDKITILEIKRMCAHGDCLQNVEYELSELNQVLVSLYVKIDVGIVERLKQINQALWDIEDEIRGLEAKRDFGKRFIELARSVYQENDKRAKAKQVINKEYGSSIVEEKLYTDYRTDGHDKHLP